jgi:hypothetical protein
MQDPRTERAKLLAQAVFWLALGVGLGVAFGDSVGRALIWVAVAVAVGLVVQRRGAIAARIGRRRPGRHP